VEIRTPEWRNTNGGAPMTVQRMKVLHLITGLEKGGAETMLAQLIGRMDKQRFVNVVVSLTQDGPIGEEIRRNGVSTRIVGMSRSSPSPAAFWRLYRLMRQERPAVVQTWLYHADFFGLIAGWLARVPAIAWNIRCSDMDERYRHGINRMLLAALGGLSRFPDVVVANSRAGRNFHGELGYRPKKWVILENGFDLEKFHPDPEARNALRHELGVPTTTQLIGLVARHDPIKDHQTFLHAAAHLMANNPNVHFVLAGASVNDANRELTSTINELELNARVHLLGSRNDIPRLTAGLDIATCCSRSEGFPNIVGEAMACAVPCVVTDVGDAALIVGDCGVVVPPGEPRALADGWQQLITKEGGAADFGRRALARIEANYSMDRCVKRYQTLYDELAQRSGAPA
jgi:glycosyltransferase involved in cell wall biosynthesis